MAGTKKVRLKRKVKESEADPKLQIKIFAGCLVLVLIGFFASLRFFVWRKQSQLNTTADLQSKGLYYQLSMPKSTYARGEPVDVLLKVQNVTSKPVSLSFYQDLEFDFQVSSEVNLLFVQVPQAVWQYSSDPDHLPRKRPHVITISPGKSKEFKATWSQQDYRGNPVSPGRYCITGFLNAQDHQETLQLRGETK